MRATKLAILLVLMIVVSSKAADLYRVHIYDDEDVTNLAGSGLEPAVRLNDGYLLLVEKDGAELLQEIGLVTELIAAAVTPSELYLDLRPAPRVDNRYPLVFEQSGLRIVQSDVGATTSRAELKPWAELRAAVTVPAEYDSRRSLDKSLGVDLDSLIGLVVQDSLYAYNLRLQAFETREAGTASADTARDWIANKFISFGYDSIYIDTFGTSNEYYNVVATKAGTRFPNHHVVVGAHRDAVPGSPGADDNGSGSSGVLEIARVLEDIETDLTFVFILFDAEEIGLVGSQHYAEEAYTRGDSIVYMFNMDMIGTLGNTNEVSVYHGDDLQFSELFVDLADSLQGVTGYLSGSSGSSDHYWFTQLGYPATFIIEWVFSPVYHTFQDSTSYMDFGYMTKLVRSALATVYTVSGTAGPRPGLTLDYVEATPEFLPPDSTYDFEVSVGSLYGGVLSPGSVELNYSVDGGAYNVVSMTDLGEGVFGAPLPAASCGSEYLYYVSAVEQTDGETFYSADPLEPTALNVAEDRPDIIYDNCETDPGWTTTSDGATSGFWQRGVPVADVNWFYGPRSDGDSSGQCWMTQNDMGNTDVDDGSVSMTSPAFDLSEGGYLSYYYYLWLNNTHDHTDVLSLEANSDGGSGEWVELTRHLSSNGSDWTQVIVDEAGMLAAGLTLTANTVFRFTALDGDPQSVVEAGIDGFHIYKYTCSSSNVCGDVDGSGAGPDISDLVYLVTYMFSQGPPPPNIETCDVNGSGAGPDITDLVYLVTYMFQQGPDLNCL